MKAVKTMQRYQCDFCKYRSTRPVVEKHERRCFRNPNRYCDHCENRGFTIERENAGELSYKLPCHYCSQFDPAKKAAIEAWEAEQQPNQVNEDVALGVDPPF